MNEILYAIIKYLKSLISIRGRFAIGLTCAKLMLREMNLLHDDFYRIYIEKIGAFTKSNKLDIWEEECAIYIYSPKKAKKGKVIVEKLKGLNQENKELSTTKDWYKNVECEILHEEFYDKLIDFHKDKAFRKVRDIIDLCYELGRAEMYGSIRDDSKITSKMLKKKILKKGNFTDEFNFEKISKEYPFKDERGWGKIFDFKTFKRK